MKKQTRVVTPRVKTNSAPAKRSRVKRPRVDCGTAWLLTLPTDEDAPFFRSALDAEALCMRGELRETGSRAEFSPPFWAPFLHDDDLEVIGTVVTSTLFDERDGPALFDSFGSVDADQAVSKLLNKRPNGYGFWVGEDGFDKGAKFTIDNDTLFISKKLASRMEPSTLLVLTTCGFSRDVCLF